MNATEYVALAKRAANDYFEVASATFWAKDLQVSASGGVCATDGQRPPDRAWGGDFSTAVVFDIILTAENTASPDALTRALLASKISIIRLCDAPSPDAYAACLSGEQGHGANSETARRNLLDALLVSVPA